MLADHLMGLPSYLNIDYENYKILEIGKEWGYDLSSEQKEDVFLSLWFSRMSAVILKLMKDNDIRLKEYI